MYDGVRLRCRMKSYLHGRPSFFGQILLIAAPLAVLSGYALYSLRQDRAFVEQEARERARALAPELARKWGETMTRLLGDQPAHKRPQGLVVDGKIVYPVDYPPLPSTPDWPEQLTPAQMLSWRTAEEVFFKTEDPEASRNALAALKSAGLPEAAMANAEFRALVQESGRSGARNLARRFTDLARRYPATLTEAGTPLADLALIQALRHTSVGTLTDAQSEELWRRVHSYPSFLVPELLALVERIQPGESSAFRNNWLADEEARRLLRSFLQYQMIPVGSGALWFEADGQPVLAIWSPGISTVTHVTMIPSVLWEESASTTRNECLDRIPSYAGVLVEVGGRRWISGTQGAPEQDLQQSSIGILASAPGKIEMRSRMGLHTVAFRENMLRLAPRAFQEIQGWEKDASNVSMVPFPFLVSQPFTLSLTLQQPERLYAGYRRRLWLAVGLILSATAAAGVGLASAWKAFRRQQRLAEMTANFVSSVSHELRSPLASVRLMAESLEQGKIAEHEKQKGYFRLIVQECRRLSALVENVLDFSRIRQGSKQYEFEPVDLPALLRQTAALMAPLAGERQVGLILEELPPEAADLRPCWDGQAVQQALVNLIDNAIKHAPAGTEVRIRLAAESGRMDSMIRIAVEDAGPGIPAAEQERIFEPFYRLGPELRRETQGIGIGLSIVKHIAEAHGGGVIVDSARGRGSRFTLELARTPVNEGDRRQASGVRSREESHETAAGSADPDRRG